jgi:4-amino-4-deoxy-L-arabinose transferase-like glycosyltransferase
MIATVMFGGWIANAVWQPSGVDLLSDLFVPIGAMSLLGGIVALLLIRHADSQERDVLGTLFMASLGLRMLFTVVVNQWSLANGGFGSYSGSVALDDWWVSQTAQRLASSWHTNGDLFSLDLGVFSGDPGYSYFVGLIYFFAGPNPLVAMFAGGIIGAASVVFVYRLSLFVVDGRKDVALTAGWIAAILPRLIWSSSVMVKDALVVPSILFLVYFTLRLTHERDLARSLVGWLVSSALLVSCRIPVAALIGFPSLAYLLFAQRSRERGLPGRYVALVLIVILISAFLLTASGRLFYLDRIFEVSAGAFVPVMDRDAFLTGQVSEFSFVAALSDVTIATLIERPYLIPVILCIVLIMPFPPFQFYPDPSAIASSQGNVVWYFVLAFAAWGIWLLWRNGNRNAQFLTFLIIGLWLSIALTYYGTQPRYVNMMMPFAAIFAAFGLRERQGATSWLIIYSYLFGAATVFYLFWKHCCPN